VQAESVFLLRYLGDFCRELNSDVLPSHSPNTKAHIRSVTWTTGLFSESGRLIEVLAELDRLALGLVLPVVSARAVGVVLFSFSGSVAADATPNQLHIAQGHGLTLVEDRTSFTSLHRHA